MTDIEIIDRGRGPQLSTSRITVQDLVPYFLRQCGYDEIRAAMPSLSDEEIAVVERYVREHRDEVLEQDRRIRARAAARRKPAHAAEDEREARLQRLESTRNRIRRQRQVREP
ncbi:MAG: hypothetical protein WD066_09075 [Planctomycetaceae bacterium]